MAQIDLHKDIPRRTKHFLAINITQNEEKILDCRYTSKIKLFQFLYKESYQDKNTGSQRESNNATLVF